MGPYKVIVMNGVQGLECILKHHITTVVVQPKLLVLVLVLSWISQNVGFEILNNF